MPLTPDRFPGPLIEEEVVLDDQQTEDPTTEGAMRYVLGSFRFKDATGVFDPRSGGSGVTEAQHKVLRQLIHFIDDGPAEGFLTGAYREVTGAVFPTAIVWWESSAKLKKIVEKLITWTGAFPTAIAWKVYDAAGALLATATDAISYTGAFETSRTRTITVP